MSGESLSRGDGTWTEFSEREPFHGFCMAVTLHSTFKLEWTRPATALPGEVGLASAEGLSEGRPGCRYLRTGRR